MGNKKKNQPKNDTTPGPFSTDAPITDPTQDKFRRWPFAQRIAQVIAAIRDPSSLVIGVYGPWGDGKTTVLNFIEKELEKSPDVICIRFNPWRFPEENQLIRDFFQTLADALKNSLSNKREKIGTLLKKYGSVVAPLTVGVGVIQLSAGDAVEKVGKTLSSVSLDELRARIENILQKEGKRVTILIDDIDRLDKSEIQTIFRLVKLSANFPYTTYVLAFDDEVVSAALGERYGAGNREAGRSFLEKIVQVPLNLPAANKSALRLMCLQTVVEALQMAQIEITQLQGQTFARHFDSGISIRLTTPRMAKRYGNAITFALPLLKGESNPVDVLLVEAMRVFYPRLYQSVRENAEIFLGVTFEFGGLRGRAKERAQGIVEQALAGLTPKETEAARDLITALFPTMEGVFGNTTYASDIQQRWANEQRVAAKEYFERYFSYTVPEGDVSDLLIDGIIADLPNRVMPEVVAELRKLVNPNNAGQFVLKLRQRTNNISANNSERLMRALARVGDVFPSGHAFLWSTPAEQAGILNAILMQRILPEHRFELAKEIIREGQPLVFSAECFRWFRSDKNDPENERRLTVEEEQKVGEILAHRIQEYCTGDPIFLREPDVTPRLLSIWSIWGDKKALSSYLEQGLSEKPENVVEFLKCYLPIAQSLGTEIVERRRLERDGYDAIAKMIDPEFVKAKLVQLLGDKLLDKEAYGKVHTDAQTAVSYEFINLHNLVLEEKRSESINPATSDVVTPAQGEQADGAEETPRSD